VNVVGCQVEVSATGRSLVQRSNSRCGVPVCDRGILTKKRPMLSIHTQKKSVNSPESHSETIKTCLEEKVDINISLDK
jgi:hypothetical protein